MTISIHKKNMVSTFRFGLVGRSLLLLLVILLSPLGELVGAAQTISVSAPQHVGVGEQFKLMYTIPTQDVKGFRAGNIPEGLEVLMGPSTSSQSSFQMVNGHTSSSSSITYTYILSAEKAGNYVIPAAHATVNGKQSASSAIKIKVSGQAQSNSNNSGSNMRQEPGAQVRQAGAHISGNDLFIKVSANKKRVHEQEPILLTYKVYTQVELTQLEGKMPDLKGFHTQEIPLPQQKSFHLENVNGRPYRCVTWSQYVMYPQMTGKLTIPSITFKGIVVQENRNVDPFEAFFNGGSGYVEVKKDIVAPSVDVTVDPLPQHPANYSGGVGRFSISGSLNKQTVAANDPVTLRIVVSGNGNLKLIKQPEVQFPKDFDKYDPKTTDKTKLTANGVEGSMIYDFLFVPRNQGDYTIPAVEFTYYDTTTNSYKTIKTNPLTLNVTPGKGGKNSVADFTDQDDQDIHNIKTSGDMTLSKDMLNSYNTCKILLIITFVIFMALMWIFRKRAIANADIIGSRVKKANKVATKRLKRAAKLMNSGKQDEFYDEVLRALWGYIGDKLNIPVAELSRDNITERLLSHGVDNGTITVFVDAIDECEFARYAPGEASGKMNNVYDKAVKGITDIDEFLKNAKKSGKGSNGERIKMLLVLFVASLCSLSGSADTLSDANAAYSKGNYQAAIKGYQELLKTTPSAELYYNLGNAYYRSDNITQAIIAYNKAALISPADKDIQHNLSIARTKTIDKMQPAQSSFIVAWWQAMVNLCNTDTWAYIALFSFIAVVLLMLVYMFSDVIILRQLGFYAAVILLVAFLLSCIFAVTQSSRLTANNGAVIIQSDCPVKKSPEQKSADETVVHEGTHLTITDETIPGWYEVTLDDGTDGWIISKAVERIIIK